MPHKMKLSVFSFKLIILHKTKKFRAFKDALKGKLSFNISRKQMKYFNFVFKLKKITSQYSKVKL